MTESAVLCCLCCVQFHEREPLALYSSSRDFNDRAFTIGIGGPVGSGQTSTQTERSGGLAMFRAHSSLSVRIMFVRQDRSDSFSVPFVAQ